VEYHVKYNNIIDQTHLKQITVVVGGKGKHIKKGYHHSNKYYLKNIVRVLLDRGHNRHLVLLPRQTHAVSLLEYAKYIEWDHLNFLHCSNSKGSTQDLMLLSKARL
jgi:hypothetical protein